MTLTIEVPDDLSLRLEALPQAYDKQAFAVAALADAVYAAEADETEDDEGELDEDLIAVLLQSREEVTGPLLTLEQVEANVFAAIDAAVARRSGQAT